MLLFKLIFVILVILQTISAMISKTGSSSLVRICIQNPDFKNTIVFLGTYIDTNYVLLQMDESPPEALWNDNKISFYMGGNSMDCQSGQYRNFVSVKPLSKPGAVLFKISKPFDITSEIPTTALSKTYNITANKCITYCSVYIDAGLLFKGFFGFFAEIFDTIFTIFGGDTKSFSIFNKFKEINKEFKACKTIKSYKHDVVLCSDITRSKEICLTKNAYDDNNSFVNSPIVCDEEVVGFAKDTDGNEFSITKLWDYMDEIEKIVGLNSKWDIIAKKLLR